MPWLLSAPKLVPAVANARGLSVSSSVTHARVQWHDLSTLQSLSSRLKQSFYQLPE
uniref:X-prolyl aminopeptidase 3 n=1 Tax=Aotus nancymaae TaxID=37293 RepID=A0A2K5CNG6_AOTNA